MRMLQDNKKGRRDIDRAALLFSTRGGG